MSYRCNMNNSRIKNPQFVSQNCTRPTWTNNIISEEVIMLLDPSTIAAFMHVCPRSMLSPALSFSLLFLLPGYNGQTHNKEGKTRDCGTRYVGRLTMEHTWARAGAFEVALGRQKVPHGAPVWNVGGGRGEEKKTRGNAEKGARNGTMLSASSAFSSSSSSLQLRLMLHASLLQSRSGASMTLSDLFAKRRTRPVTWYACCRKATRHYPSCTLACA